MHEPTRLRLAVIADSHVRVEGDSRQDAHPSDPTHNDRNRRVVQLLRVARPDVLVHLGDVVHPVPRLEAQHEAALRTAQRCYAPLGDIPRIVVPGNHDVGDKARPWANAPGATEALHTAFQRTWNPPWGVQDHGPVRLLWIDTPILGTGSEQEEAQWCWLERVLAESAEQRILLFTHYPLYLYDDREPEHYDNLGREPRQRLLRLIDAHPVEAVFSGHVHRRFWDRRGETELYIAPATSFVRPEYAELDRLAPQAEAGRDDADLLGFFLVHIHDRGHSLELVRALDAPLAEPQRLHPRLRPGASASPSLGLGSFLRHDPAQAVDIPYASLDEFARKQARPDEQLYAMWDAGIDRLRVPLADADRPSTARRLQQLASRGIHHLLFSAGLPTAAQARRIQDLPWAEAWEVVVPRGLAHRAARRLERIAPGCPCYLSVAGGLDSDPSYFSHFPPHGFHVDEPLIDELLPGPAALVFRVPWTHPAPLDLLQRIAGRGAHMAHVELPRGTEGTLPNNDLAAAAVAAEALVAARCWPDLRIFLDTLVDHDRGYWPRTGLMDRRGVPRPAGRLLRVLSRLLPPRLSGPPQIRQESGLRRIELAGIGSLLPLPTPRTLLACGRRWVDLCTGQLHPAQDGPSLLPGPVLLLPTRDPQATD